MCPTGIAVLGICTSEEAFGSLLPSQHDQHDRSIEDGDESSQKLARVVYEVSNRGSPSLNGHHGQTHPPLLAL